MSVSVSRLRYWFLSLAIAILVVVAGFYSYAHHRVINPAGGLPKKLGVDIEQSTQGFSMSKSEEGRTIYTIRASEAVAHKRGGVSVAELKNVSIVVYGRQSDRFDQIYGSDFEYNQDTGMITAVGEVHIDLESDVEGMHRPDQAPPPELKNPIHIVTSGLIFNQTSGFAETKQRLELHTAQASGSAVGATYDSKHNLLLLHSQVHLVTSGPRAVVLDAQRGTLSKNPGRAVLDTVHMVRDSGTTDADQMTVFLRPDNTVERVLGVGNVRSTEKGTGTDSRSLLARADQGEFFLSPENEVQSAVLSGGVNVESQGERPANAQAGRILLGFGPENRIEKIHAVDGVRMTQLPSPADSKRTPQDNLESGKQTITLVADAADFNVQGGSVLSRAETQGRARIEITPESSGEQAAAKANQPTRTVITAGKFVATFDQEGRMKAVHGAPDAKVVSSVPAQADKVSTSRELEISFSPMGGISNFLQQGNFQYREPLPAQGNAPAAERAAWSEQASFDPGTDVLTLTGNPRIVERGMTTTARVVRMNRRSGDAEAQDNVKTTYSDLSPNPGGALLASGDPIHVTARAMSVHGGHGLGEAHYTGGVRLWQGADIIEAPVVDFDQQSRTVIAQGQGQRVTTLLVQQNKSGKITPVTVTSNRLVYQDSADTARFEGLVVMRGADGILTCDNATVYLAPQSPQRANTGLVGVPGGKAVPGNQSSRVDHIVADRQVVVEEPGKKATGQHLVYTAAEQKYVMTGGPPSMFDAEHGTITGTSLTFYTSDDRVLVESAGKTRTVTETRVSR